MSIAAPPIPVHRVEIGLASGMRDPRGEHVARQIREFLHLPVERVRTRDVYHVEGELTPTEVERVARELADPVLQRAALGRLEDGPFGVAVRVAYKPGVADPVGKSARVAIEDTLGRFFADDAAVYTSTLYLLDGITAEEAERVARELLANPLIQAWHVATHDAWTRTPPDLSIPKVAGGERPPVRAIDLDVADEELERLSREGFLALSLPELRAIRDHFRRAASHPRRDDAGLGARPTDVELECLAQTWSEHCKHKIFNATITYREQDGEPETIDSLFSTYIRGTTEALDRRLREERGGERDGGSWLVSVFHDNAGVVAFDDQIHLVYKVETHNTPSALDPYGGAITGIVGVNRDPFGTGRGADLLVNVWGYCFAPPDHGTVRPGELPAGLLHPRRVREGVHRGVIDGGNQSGIPYGRGWELFDARYLGKPLVFCGTVGALPVTIAGTPGEEKGARPGDRIVMVGGRIGADGIHGATFSSAALEESSPAQAVQIGDPITQKMMFDFLLEARDRGLYSAITDNGAGGLSSSVGEMARGPGGARLDLARAPLKYAGLAPWEVFLSEAQERMTVAVPPQRLAAFLALAGRRQVEATDLGEFTGDGVLEVRWSEEIVGLLDMEFLHDGAPEMRLPARWAPRAASGPDDEPARRPADCGRTLLDLVGRRGLASNETRARHYDHEVKGLTAVKPWVGAGQDVPAEATVFLARHGSLKGFVLSEGVHPWLSDLDPEAMAMVAVDEAVRRQLAAGARIDRIAALDNFCWPDPVLSEQTPDGDFKLGQLVRACRGLQLACLAYGVPLISGKDSMKNESVVGGVKICVPPTLLVSAIGQIDDVRAAVTLDFKEPGDVVFLLGATGEHTGGSEYFRYLGERDGRTAALDELAPYVGRTPPTVDAESNRHLYEAFHDAVRDGLVRSAAVPGLGGLAVALARAAMAGELGARLDLEPAAGMTDLDPDVALFSESAGRLVVSVAAAEATAFAERFAGLACARIGAVTEERRLVIERAGEHWLDLTIHELKNRYKASSPELKRPAASGGNGAGGIVNDGERIDALRALPGEELAARRAAVRVLVVTGLGLNCEVETARAFRLAGATPRLVHLLDLLDGARDRRLLDFHILALPGGFAFGDHLGAGFVFANKIRHRMYDELVAFLERGGLAIGICNGFQTMTRLGMLPGFDGDYRTPRATLAPNDRLGYRNAWVRLRAEPASPCVWTRGVELLELPARHGEGKFLTESPEVFARLETGGQIALRYVDERGEATEDWPANPNGSPGGVAAVCDPSGRIFGIMPHPDAFLYPFQHPQWFRAKSRGEPTPADGDGLAIFRNGVDAAAAAAWTLPVGHGGPTPLTGGGASL